MNLSVTEQENDAATGLNPLLDIKNNSSFPTIILALWDHCREKWKLAAKTVISRIKTAKLQPSKVYQSYKFGLVQTLIKAFQVYRQEG